MNLLLTILFIPFGYFYSDRVTNYQLQQSKWVETIIHLEENEIEVSTTDGSLTYKVDKFWPFSQHENIYYFRGKNGINTVYYVLRHTFNNNRGHKITLEYDREHWEGIPKNQAIIQEWSNIKQMEKI